MRRGKAVWVCALAAGFVAAQSAQGVIVFQDDFESYADEAAMEAPGAWGDTYDSEGDTGTSSFIPAPFGNPGNALFHSGGRSTVNVFPASPVVTDAQPLLIEFDYWDYQTGTADRQSLGLRNTAGSAAGAFIEIGEYNAADPDVNAEGDTLVQGYAIRLVFAGAPSNGTPANQNWYIIAPNDAKVTGGWHHFRVEIGETYADASVNIDTDLDGTPDTLYSVNIPLTAHVGKSYDVVRLGGPSNVSSTAPAGFDNIKIQIIPEPAAALLLGFGSLLMMRRRRVA